MPNQSNINRLGQKKFQITHLVALANCDGNDENSTISCVQSIAKLLKFQLDDKIAETYDKGEQLHGNMFANFFRTLFLRGKFGAIKKSTLIVDRYRNFQLEIDSVAAKAVDDIRKVNATPSKINNYTRMADIQWKATQKMEAIANQAPLKF